MNVILAFLPLLIGVVLSYLASYIHSEITNNNKRNYYIRSYGAVLIPLTYLLFYLMFGSI